MRCMVTITAHDETEVGGIYRQPSKAMAEVTTMTKIRTMMTKGWQRQRRDEDFDSDNDLKILARDGT